MMRRARLLLSLMFAAWPQALLAWAGSGGIPPVQNPDAELSEMVAVVHLHSRVVDGASSPLQIARRAREAGVDALIFTDHFLERVVYAPWPLGNALGIAISRPSVTAYGVGRYLRELHDVEQEVPGLVIVPGLEVTPHARWVGSLLRRDLQLLGWHRHMLVVGLNDPGEILRLPVAGNRTAGVYNAWSLIFLLPALAVVWAWSRIRRPDYRETRVGPFVLRRRRRPIREVAIGIVCAGILAAGFPFRVPRFSPVGPDPGAAPFDELSSRVRDLGGVTIWAHPEAAATRKGPLGIRMTTDPYADLVGLTDADGFGGLPEGVKTILPPGGIWDRALLDHLRGRRPHPLFALAELDEHSAAETIDPQALQTIFLVRERSRAGILEALRSGRLYGRWTPRDQEPLTLPTFRIEAGGESAVSGGSIAASGPVTIRLEVRGGSDRPVTARIVRAGEVIWTVRRPPPIEEVIEDDAPRPTYYRLDVEGAYPYRLISNPITIKREGKGA